MSPHVEYWGIPSPVEELYRTPETDSPLTDGESALAGGSQFFVMARPDKLMKSRSRGKEMRENSFKAYKIRVFRAILKIDRKANPASLGETLIRHYFNAGYTERSAVTAMIEVVTVQTPFRPSAYSLQRL